MSEETTIMATENKSQAITKAPPEAITKAVEDIEKVLEQCNTTALATMPALTQAVTLATGMQQLREALSEQVVKQVFMPLQSSTLGFVTDKDRDGGYPWQTVRDCMIEAMVNGLRPVNNEINIISNRMYAAKNGLARRVSEFPGVSDLRITPGVPVFGQDMKDARISIRADLLVHGKPVSVVREVKKDADGTVYDTRIVVRVNSGMGADAVIGKATRKILKATLDTLMGCTFTVSDGDALDTTGEVVTDAPSPAPPEQDGKRIKLGKNGQTAAATVPHDPETGEVTESASAENDGR